MWVRRQVVTRERVPARGGRNVRKPTLVRHSESLVLGEVMLNTCEPEDHRQAGAKRKVSEHYLPFCVSARNGCPG